MVSVSLHREEYAKKKRNKLLWKFVIFVLIIIFLIGLLSYVSYRPSLRISKIELSGGILITKAEVEPKVLEFMYGSYFWIFPKSNAFLYPRDDIEEYLKETFKRIDSINVSRKNFTTLSIKITERKPDSLWCDVSPDVGPAEHCYFMDENGTIFTEAPLFSGDAYFKYYGLVSTSTPIIGSEYMASTTQFREISDFVSSVKEMSLNPDYLLAKEESLPAKSWKFTLVLSSGTQIYFDLNAPLSRASSNLSLLLKNLTTATNTDPTKLIDYIDLRFGNKLFYKIR